MQCRRGVRGFEKETNGIRTEEDMKQLPFRQIHMDFHTSEAIPGVGDGFDAEAFVRTLKDAYVNSINLFARCHHGWVYYDSKKFSNKHPSLKINLLKEQLEACRAAGIATPVYITCGWDEYVARTHPEWLERTADGRPFGAGPLQPAWKKLCLNTPYVDYHEAQVVDVLETFGDLVDGVWLDIIFQDPCCCPYCMASMRAKGYDPASETDRDRHAAEVVARYKERITKTIRTYSPDCLIFYNAGHIGPSIRRSLDAYTHLEIESLPGLRAGWGYEHFPITVRYVKTLGREYIGMTGKFHGLWGDFGGFKNRAALEYECFTTIAHGAKCCVGDQLHPSGRICPATYALIGSVYQQVAAKEPWCGGVEAVSDIGVATPESATGGRPGGLGPAIRGAYRMLEEGHHQFDVIDAESALSRYRVVILPDTIAVDDAFRAKLEAYLEHGGNLILSYRSALNGDRFALDAMGVDFVCESEFDTEYVMPRASLLAGLAETPYVLYERGLWVQPKEGAEVLAALWKPYFSRTYEHFCSHRQTPFESESEYPAAVQNGRVIYFSHPFFSMYHEWGMAAHKRLVLNALERLLPDPVVRTNAPSTARVNLNHQVEPDRYVLHVLHYIPEARSKQADIIEDVIPLHDVEVKVRLPRRPKSVYLAPSETPLAFHIEDGCATTVIPEVAGHEMVVFE